MRQLARMRWGAFGLRGRLVGAVIVTTALTLLVAAAVLLPRLEQSLRTAAQKTLKHEVGQAGQDLQQLRLIPYTNVALLGIPGTSGAVHFQAVQAARALTSAEAILIQRLGATTVNLVGYIDRYGRGRAISTAPGPAGSAGADDDDAEPAAVSQAFLQARTVYTFGNLRTGTPVVQAAIYLGSGSDSVLVVRKAIDEIPGAVSAVRRAFEIAAAAAILLILLLAIPLAGTVVKRLQRLRVAALQMAAGGSGSAIELPTDRVRDEVGDLARSFSIMHRRLRQQEEARRAFVATASHELRTPLASLEVMLELLAEDLKSDQIDIDDQAMLLDRARAQSRRLGRLAADLLDLSRIDAQVELRTEPVELGELVRAVLAEFELAAAEHGVRLGVQEGDARAWALADPGSVAQILRILLDNALRVAPRGTAVTAQVTPGESPRLTVSDGGPGIEPAERNLIFERFKRGRETGGEAGFGLGLAIGRELAQRMGGSLNLVERDGPGASFTLTLPPANAPTGDRVPDPVGA